jgi:hypothetical protein
LSFAQMPCTRPDPTFAHVIDTVERVAANVSDAPRSFRQPWFAMLVQTAQPVRSAAAVRTQAARHYGADATFDPVRADRAGIARELGVDAGDDLDSEAEGSDEAGGAHVWLDLTFELTGD